jgi:hypothetical protein
METVATVTPSRRTRLAKTHAVNPLIGANLAHIKTFQTSLKNSCREPLNRGEFSAYKNLSKPFKPFKTRKMKNEKGKRKKEKGKRKDRRRREGMNK